MNITVIGETNLDILVKDQGPLSKMGCTPTTIAFHYGGVARNIATDLRKMGHEVQLMTLFGDDDYANKLILDCKSNGIDLSLSEMREGFHSPIFLSLTDGIGNVKTAFSDMEINTLMSKKWVENKVACIKRSDVVVADTLLNAEALAFLIDHCEVPVFIDAVSPNKALRLSEALKMTKQDLFVLKCNEREALAMTNLKDAKSSAFALNSMGINHVFVTQGAKGVIYCDGRNIIHAPALSADIVNVMGSGDAFLAGVVDAFSKGAIGKAALPYGQAASKSVIESGDN